MKTDKKIPMRKRDILTIKIVDWSDDPKDCEPAIDVEVYINGVFDFEKSHVFSINEGVTKNYALFQAKNFAILAVKNNME